MIFDSTIRISFRKHLLNLLWEFAISSIEGVWTVLYKSDGCLRTRVHALMPPNASGRENCVSHLSRSGQ